MRLGTIVGFRILEGRIKNINHHKVGILTTRHFMIEYAGVGSTNSGFKTTVQEPDLGPIEVKSLDVFITDARAQISLLQCHAHSTHGRLRG